MAATKAIAVLERQKISFETLTYGYQPDVENIGLFAAQSLNIDPAFLLKTLMIETGQQPVIALVPTDRSLDLKALAKIIGQKKCALMAKDVAERLSGYVIGGISPLGQKRRLKIYLDDSVKDATLVTFNGGQRGLQIQLRPDDLVTAGDCTFAKIT